LHWAYIERWLVENDIKLDAIERGDKVWPTADGRVALTIKDIERFVSIKDPVAWAWLNLIERDPTINDETGEIIKPAGVPWSLFAVQATMARMDGNVIFECAAEVGKTRDLVLGTLHEVDTLPGASNLIAADSDITLEEIAGEIDFQLDANRLIGGGLLEPPTKKPYREWKFKNGSRFQMRLCGYDGKQFRGGHFAPSIRADEAAKWKNLPQWSELWRAAKPGGRFRIYSTPDGDYSSPFYALCHRALRVGGDTGPVVSKASKDEPKFRKLNITKMDLPPPFWTESRAAKYREQYGGENSVGWQTNVLGCWGSPSYSVFPMPTLKPNLKGGISLPHYRIVVALIDRERARVQIRAARLTPDADSADGGARREELLLREERPLLSGKDLGVALSAFFPPLADWIDPALFCGGDLGSSQDPTELVFVRRVGLVWSDVFRLHLANGDWPLQAEVIMALDCASGHRVRYGFDSGSAGLQLVQVLTQTEPYRTCFACRGTVYFAERLRGFGFGDYCDEIDVETGATIPNLDKVNAAGEPLPFRISNKEFSTRILERKAQAGQLWIANDAGAEDQRLSGPQLLVNHTYDGVTAKGQRRFKEDDDHHVDARRQAALAIAALVRGEPFVQPDPAMVLSAPGRRLNVFGEASPGVASVFGASRRFDWT
jgi:hypothetical protein